MRKRGKPSCCWHLPHCSITPTLMAKIITVTLTAWFTCRRHLSSPWEPPSLGLHADGVLGPWPTVHTVRVTHWFPLNGWHYHYCHSNYGYLLVYSCKVHLLRTNWMLASMQGYKVVPHSKKKLSKNSLRGCGYNSVAMHFPGMHKALGSTYITKRRGRKRKRRKKRMSVSMRRRWKDRP